MREQRRIRAKLKEEAFFRALKAELLNQKEFSIKIGSQNPQYISKLSNPKHSDITASPTYVKRILDGFSGKYTFDELMYWVD